MDSIVVTHGTVITLYMATVANIRPICFWRSLGLPSYVILTLPTMHVRSIVESCI